MVLGHIMAVPEEIHEAARIDGASALRILTAAVLAFLNNWNEYYWSSLVLIDAEKLTVPALLSNFTTGFETNYNGLFSAIIVTILPPIAVYAFCSRFFVQALSGGAVKG